MHHMPVQERIPCPERPPIHISPKLLSSSSCRSSLSSRLLPPLQLLLLPLALQLRLMLSGACSTVRALAA
jgi:hypothetical protein